MTEDKDEIRKGMEYQLLLKHRGEEYAELFAATDEERMNYICWWASNYDTENDQIKNLGLEPEYFATLHEAKQFLKEMQQETEQEKK